jgi:chromosome segregation ATPase
MSLKTNVQVIRNAARDVARMQTIEKFMVTRADYRQAKQVVVDRKASLEKSKTIQEYDLAKLDTQHPAYDTKKQYHDDSIADLTQAIAKCDQDIADWDKKLAEISTKIDQVEAGETKMLIDRVNSIAQDILNAIPSVIAAKIDISIAEEDN